MPLQELAATPGMVLHVALPARGWPGMNEKGAPAVETSERIDYRRLAASDLDQVAELHATVFQGYFLTLMGRRFLRRYYGQYLDFPGALTVVALAGDRVVGFIVGGRDIDQLQRRLYRRHFFELGAIVVSRFLVDRTARAAILERGRIVRAAINEALRRRERRTRPPPKSQSSAAASKPPYASILVIAVGRAYRDLGIGGQLMERFIEAARAAGVTMVRGTVRSDNPEHVARKSRAGWSVIYSDDKKVLFGLDISGQDLPRVAARGEDDTG